MTEAGGIEEREERGFQACFWADGAPAGPERRHFVLETERGLVSNPGDRGPVWSLPPIPLLIREFPVPVTFY